MKETKVINRSLLMGYSAICCILVVAYILEFIKGHRTFPYFIVFSCFLLIPLAVAFFVFIKYPESSKFAYIASIGYGVTYGFVLFTGNTSLVFTYAFPMLGILVITSRYHVIMSYLGMLVSSNLLQVGYKIIVLGKRDSHDITDYEIQIATIVLSILLATLATKISNQLSTDKMNTIKENAKEQQNMINKMTATNVSIIENATKLVQVVEQLKSGANITEHSMQDIVKRTNEMVVSVENQLAMTSEIQDSIVEATELSSKIDAATSITHQHIEKGIVNMDTLNQSAATVLEHNSKVVSDMVLLNTKMKEVMNIISIINDVTNQTNLLALNASIEAARAGEAGKGFAVVAGEVTHLAEQTKVATENISNLISELETSATKVRESIEEVSASNETQNQLIFDTQRVFDLIKESVNGMIVSTTTQSESMKEIKEKNGSIVEAIHTISDACNSIEQESKNTHALSNENLCSVQVVEEVVKELNKKVM